MHPNANSPLQRPQLRSPFSPTVFYPDSVGSSALRIVLLHKSEHVCLGGAFQFQCLAGQIVAKSYTFEPVDYEENNLFYACLPSLTHEPIQFRVSPTSPPLLQDGEDILRTRLTAINFNYDRIKDAIVNAGFSAIILITDPPAKLKPIENVTGWMIFKPLPLYRPQELSLYFYMTNMVPTESQVCEFSTAIHKMWNSKPKSAAMIMGSKDSGKSTILKEVCNALLNSKPQEAQTIYYLDCDVGQSEFTPPGLLSIVKVDKPLFNFGKDILDYTSKIFEPGCVLALKRTLLIHVPDNVENVIFQDAYTVPDNRKLSPPKLRDLAITGYFTQCFSKSVKHGTASFTNVLVRMISFEKIGIFIHPSHIVSDKAYLAALNMSTVALCIVPDKFKEHYKWRKLCGKENLPSRVDYADQISSKPFLKCVGYGLVRAISLEKRKIYIITPADPFYLMDVNVLAIGNDINTPQWILQTQNSSNAPYLMHSKTQNDFNLLSMPLKIIGMHKRNVFRNR